jgi:nicotinate-nucleotide adenylyltransferase
MRKTVGIFGGTFDPPHLGHLSLIQSFLDFPKIDELWVIPALESPHKVGEVSSSFDHRYQMCKVAFSGIENLFLKDIEASFPKPSYTFRTLQYLKEHHSACEFVLCLGLDSLYSFNRWVKWEAIINENKLIVAERKGILRKEVEKKIVTSTEFIEAHKAVDFSSSEIRLYINKLAFFQDISDEKLQQLGLNADVFSYIEKHDLYK